MKPRMSITTNLKSRPRSETGIKIKKDWDDGNVKRGRGTYQAFSGEGKKKK